jgi:hypothetical protein
MVVRDTISETTLRRTMKGRQREILSIWTIPSWYSTGGLKLQENAAMSHRRNLILPVLAAWASLSLALATAQTPPEPTVMPSATGCPEGDDALGQFKDLSEIHVGMQLEGREVPPDCSQAVFHGTRPGIAMTEQITEFHWAPTNFFHRPLYFDDTPLERYGQSVAPHFQPILSGGRFFLTVPILPYKMGYDHPYDCVTTLGYYRPGICAPCVKQVPPPLNWHSALLQAGTTVGIVLLLP